MLKAIPNSLLNAVVLNPVRIQRFSAIFVLGQFGLFDFVHVVEINFLMYQGVRNGIYYTTVVVTWNINTVFMLQ